MENVGPTYESLPELLGDLQRMVHGVNFDEEIIKRLNWDATIRCGGNYHTINFTTRSNDCFMYLAEPISSNSEKSSQLNAGSEGFADFDSLNAELNHIRDFITNNKDLADLVKMNYTIQANGTTPHLTVQLAGTYNIANENCHDCDDNYFANVIQPKESIVSRTFRRVAPLVSSVVTVAVAMPLIILPTLYIAKRIGI